MINRPTAASAPTRKMIICASRMVCLHRVSSRRSARLLARSKKTPVVLKVPVIVATKRSRRSMEKAAAEVGLLNCPAIHGGAAQFAGVITIVVLV
jgi:hypothetical protein